MWTNAIFRHFLLCSFTDNIDKTAAAAAIQSTLISLAVARFAGTSSFFIFVFFWGF